MNRSLLLIIATVGDPTMQVRSDCEAEVGLCTQGLTSLEPTWWIAQRLTAS